MLLAAKQALGCISRKQKASYTVNAGITVKVSPEYPLTSKQTHAADGKQEVFPRRYMIAVLGFLSFAILNTQRVNLPIALMAMKNSSAAPIEVGNWTGEFRSNATRLFLEGVPRWSSAVDGHILGSGFVGFVLTQFPGGRISEVFGASRTLTFGVFLASLCNVLSPSALAWSVQLLVAAQFVKGMAQGLFQPAACCLMSRWYPEGERSFLTSAAFSGYPAGALLGGIGSGALCDSSFLGGWPSAFYVFGFLGAVLVLLIPTLVSDSPEEYERRKNSVLEDAISEKDTSVNPKSVPVPWLKMFLSIPTWSLFAGMLGQYWMTFYFISVHPAYLSSVLQFNVTESGVLSSVPYIAQIVVTWAGSYISDWLVREDYVTTNNARKTYNTLSCVIFSVSMLLVVYAGRSTTLNTVCFFVAMSSIGLGFSGSLTTPLDMTKEFAGTLMGLSCTVASVSGFIIPIVMGYATNEQQTVAGWNIILYTSVAVVMCSAVVFHLFGSAELQDWDSVNCETERESSTKKSKNGTDHCSKS